MVFCQQKVKLFINKDMKNLINKNSYYEGLLQDFFASSDGCFCLFMTFFYQYNQIVEYKSEFEPLFLMMYQAELQNSEIISQLIIEMGGDAKYYSHSKNFLSCHSVDCVKGVMQIFLDDIEKLEISIIQNKSLINKIDDPKIKEKLHTVLKNKQKCLKNLRENHLKNCLIKK